MAAPFDSFVKKKDFLICMDSDGCAMDTMDITHTRCFGPCLVDEWELDAWREPILKRWNDINLYTMTRGINRFKGLAMALKEINDKLTPIENVADLLFWTETAPELSNRTVEAMLAQTGSVVFKKALSWSAAVDRSIKALPRSEKRPFAGVAEGLAAARKLADVAVVSGAGRDTVEEEWQLYGLLENVDVLLCQDSGSKAYCIGQLLKKGYAPDHVLVVGDAPGDREAAQANGVYYYPILVRREKESWDHAPAAFQKLVSGTYGPYGKQMELVFLDNLKGE